MSYGREAALGGRGVAGIRDGYGLDFFRSDGLGDSRAHRERNVGGTANAFDALEVQAQVIVADPERRCRNYSEMFLTKLKKIGLVCDIIILDQFTSPSQVIEQATTKGLLYTATVTMQNEMHRSITVNILQGQPQEHRNMPYEDALKLVARNFDAHLLKLGGGNIDAAPTMQPYASKAEKVDDIDPKLSLMLINLAEGKKLKLKDLDAVIDYLKKKREKVIGVENPGQPIVTTYQQREKDARALMPKPVQPPKVGSKAASAQAEDLQEKINQLFGDRIKQQSTVGVKLTTPLRSDRDNYPVKSEEAKKPVGIDFNNPTVQNALQNLMKTGPEILNTIPRSSPHDVSSAARVPSYRRKESEDAAPSKRAKPGRHAIAGFY